MTTNLEESVRWNWKLGICPEWALGKMAEGERLMLVYAHKIGRPGRRGLERRCWLLPTRRPVRYQTLQQCYSLGWIRTVEGHRQGDYYGVFEITDTGRAALAVAERIFASIAPTSAYDALAAMHEEARG
jgi:hypothetical protein